MAVTKLKKNADGDAKAYCTEHSEEGTFELKYQTSCKKYRH